MEVAHRQQRSRHVDGNPQARARAEIADVHVAAVLARRVGAEALPGGGRPGVLGIGWMGPAAALGERVLPGPRPLEELRRRRHADRARVHAGGHGHPGQLIRAGHGAVQLPARQEGTVEEIAEETRAGPDRGPAEVVGLVAQQLDLEQVAGLGAAHLEGAGERMRDVRGGEEILVRRVAREAAVTRVADLEADLVAGVARGYRLQLWPPAVVPAGSALVERRRAVGLDTDRHRAATARTTARSRPASPRRCRLRSG